MNTQTPTYHDRPSIRSTDFSRFEKPRKQPHWSYDETLAPRAAKRRPPNLVAQALRMLSAMTAE